MASTMQSEENGNADLQQNDAAVGATDDDIDYALASSLLDEDQATSFQEENGEESVLDESQTQSALDESQNQSTLNGSQNQSAVNESQNQSNLDESQTNSIATNTGENMSNYGLEHYSPFVSKKKQYEMDRQAKLSKHTCDKCFLVFKTAKSLQDHLARHLNISNKCAHCPKAFDTAGKKIAHESTHMVDDNYACAVCGKTFDIAWNLRAHVRTHSGEPPHVCEYCEKQFSELGTLLVHRKIHGDDGSYVKCKECTKTFGTEEEMQLHAVVHLTDRKWVCDKCGKAFRRKDALEKHGLIHSGIRAFVCQYCKKRFLGADSLSKHVKHHTNEQKRYRCEHCSRGYVTGGMLKTHMSVTECRICREPIPARCLLRKHMFSHTGSKAVNVCPHCNQNFVTPSGLETHVKKSTEGPAEGQRHTCHLCKSWFMYRCLLKQHLRVKHTRFERYTCKICNEYLSTEKAFEAHMHAHDPKFFNRSLRKLMKEKTDALEKQHGYFEEGYDDSD